MFIFRYILRYHYFVSIGFECVRNFIFRNKFKYLKRGKFNFCKLNLEIFYEIWIYMYYNANGNRYTSSGEMFKLCLVLKGDYSVLNKYNARYLIFLLAMAKRPQAVAWPEAPMGRRPRTVRASVQVPQARSRELRLDLLYGCLFSLRGSGGREPPSKGLLMLGIYWQSLCFWAVTVNGNYFFPVVIR